MSRFFTILVLPFAMVSQDKKPPPKPAAPSVLYAVPLVAKPGEKQKLVLRGLGLAGVKSVKASGASNTKVLGAKTVNVPPNYPADRVGDSQVEIELELPKNAKTGEVKLTAVSQGGESLPYTLLVRDSLPAIVEKEPNDSFAQAQAVSVPCAIEGSIQSERESDVYQFSGKQGEKIRIEVQAARFGSPLDALIVLHGPSRAVIASADDTDGSTDPALDVTLPSAGIYHLSVIDARDLGSSHFFYRLILRRDQ
ncbi:MAG TPA: PPC domain-containing protein [Gemmata sp.]|nr:PPC domain-containing protein [Gemmata sp.]